MSKYFIGIYTCVILILSCKVSKETLTPPITLTECNKVRTILFKNYNFLQANMNKGSLESIQFDLIYNDYTNYDEILNRMPDLKDRDALKDFLMTKYLKEISVRDTTCIGFLFRRDRFLIWYKFQELIYHTPELQPYGEADTNPEKCRLTPTFTNPKRDVILKEKLDSNWLFFVGRGRYGPPS